MNTHSLSTTARRGMVACSVAAVLAATAPMALAQSTGNPKGSAPPPRSDAQKAPAARPPTGGFGDSGKIVTDESQAKSRTQTTRPNVNPAPPQSTPEKAPGRSGSGPDAKGAGPTAKPTPQ